MPRRIGKAEPFYLGLGFLHTGRVDDDEIVLELPLDQNAGPASPVTAP